MFLQAPLNQRGLLLKLFLQTSHGEKSIQAKSLLLANIATKCFFMHLFNVIMYSNAFSNPLGTHLTHKYPNHCNFQQFLMILCIDKYSGETQSQT